MNCILAAVWKSSACALIFFYLAFQSLAGEPIGYAWPKGNLLVPDKTPTQLGHVRVSDVYPVVKIINDTNGEAQLPPALDNSPTQPFSGVGTSHAGREAQNWFITAFKSIRHGGYLIICRAADGSKRVGFLPFFDRLGNRTSSVEDSGNRIAILSDFVELEPGYFPFQASQKYPVFSRDNQNLGILFSFETFTQMVFVAESDVKFMLIADYTNTIETIIQNLKSKADNAFKEGRFGGIGNVFKLYQGDFAQDTADIREELANEYEKKAARAARERAEAEQRAVQERAEAGQKRYEAEQKAKGFVKYDDQWLTPQEIQQRKEEDKRSALRLRYVKSCAFVRRATGLLDRYKGFDRESLEKLLDVEGKYKVAYEGTKNGDVKLDEAEHFEVLADKVWTNVYTRQPMYGYKYDAVFRDEVAVPVDFGQYEDGGYVQIGDGDRKTIAVISAENLKSIGDGLRKSEEWADERSLVLLENPAPEFAAPLRSNMVIGNWDSIHLEYVPQKDELDCYVLLTANGASVKLNMLNVHCLLVRMGRVNDQRIRK